MESGRTEEFGKENEKGTSFENSIYAADRRDDGMYHECV